MKQNNPFEEIQNFLKILLDSTYEKFIKKVYDKRVNFVEQTNKKSPLNQNEMTILPKAQLKEIIYESAMQLLQQNGRTTNLDIKIYARGANPGVMINQSEVSDLMNELSNEKTDWNRNPTAGGYNEYTPIQTFPSTQTTPPVTSPMLLPAAPVANQTAVTPALIGKVSDHTIDFLKGLDQNVRIVFASGFDEYLTNTTDKYTARKLYNKEIAGAKWDDIRMITIEKYLQRNK